jgi:hypothetical protein
MKSWSILLQPAVPFLNLLKRYEEPDKLLVTLSTQQFCWRERDNLHVNIKLYTILQLLMNINNGQSWKIYKGFQNFWLLTYLIICRKSSVDDVQANTVSLFCLYYIHTNVLHHVELTHYYVAIQPKKTIIENIIPKHITGSWRAFSATMNFAKWRSEPSS